jgi:hypothetical protein
MKNHVKKMQVAAFSFVLLMALVALPVSAQSNDFNVMDAFRRTLGQSGLVPGGDNARLPSLESSLGQFISSILVLIGTVTFALIVYAGGLWVTAAGNEEKVDQAKRILKGSVLGLLVIFTAFVLVQFALTALQSAVRAT